MEVSDAQGALNPRKVTIRQRQVYGANTFREQRLADAFWRCLSS